MRVLIRVDASVNLGTGHVMRCLTLAGELRALGAEVVFVSRELLGHLCDTIAGLGFSVRRLPAPVAPDTGWLGVKPELDRDQTRDILSQEGGADWLVIDHYSLDQQWESALRPWAKHLMVIDDLANRRHDADLLLDQNLCAGMETRYKGLVPEGCRMLLGPRFALLRPEFRQAKRRNHARNGQVRRLLVFFGGVDLTNETGKALSALGRVNWPRLEVDVVVGASNPHLAALREHCEHLSGVTLHVATRNMAELMARADLALGAGGATTWERCYLGLPALILTLAENQVALAEAVDAAGAAWNLGPAETVGVDAFAREIQRILASPDEIAGVSRRALTLMDLNGCGASVAEAMMEVGRVDV